MIRIKDIPLNERPREKAYQNGVGSLSNQELITIILKNGTCNASAQVLASKILSKIDSINKIYKLSLNDLMSIKGIGLAKAITLLASIELGRRICLTPSINPKDDFSNPETIVSYFQKIYEDTTQEELYCLYLDQKNHLLGKKMLFKGTINQSVIHPREIFKEAYLLSATSFICIHNHPSGDPTPSKMDIQTTISLYELGKMHGIYLLDHLIIANSKYYSFYLEKNVII